MKVTTREALHQLVDGLADDQAELARVWLEDLRYASDEDGLRHWRLLIAASQTSPVVA